MNHKSYKFRIYPNKTQANLIDQTCGMVRKYWNECVAAFNGYHKDYCPKPIYLTSKEFREKYEWAKGLSNQALSQKFRDFIGTKTQYFNKKRKTPLGRMKFKSKHRSRNSYRIDSRRFKIKEGKIRLEKIGWMKFDNHRQLPENAKLLSCTVSEKNGKYYASICFKYENNKERSSKDLVGIDMGIKTAVTLSTGKVYSLPDFSENQTKIKKLQKILSKKKKGSNRWKKAKLKLARSWEDLTNKRNWYLHQISAEITDDFGDICLETLDVESMKCKIKNINRALTSSCISTLVEYITYKAIDKGSQVLKVDKWYPSSQICSNCGNQQKMSLEKRIYSCNCGVELDRDHNAAINIKNTAIGVQIA